MPIGGGLCKFVVSTATAAAELEQKIGETSPKIVGNGKYTCICSESELGKRGPVNFAYLGINTLTV